MIDSIQIKGYKKLDDITLDWLKSINYLVWPNGCWKSSILEAISMVWMYWQSTDTLNSRFIRLLWNPKELFKSWAFIKFTGSNINASWITDIYNFSWNIPNIITRQAPWWLAIITRGFMITTISDAQYFNGNLKSDYYHSILDLIRYEVESIDSDTKDSLKAFLNDYFFNPWKWEKKIQRIYRSIDNDNSIQLENEDGRIINLKALSTWQLSLLGLYFSISSALKKFFSQSWGEYFIALDEPENSFHPDLQKNINSILRRIVDEVKRDFDITLQFIVSTHSPFIIKSIEWDYTKIYLIKDGKTVNLRQEPWKSDGYGSSMCVWVASKMLWAWLEDLSPDSRLPIIRTNSIRIIYCEGDSSEADALYYNIIFPEFWWVKNHFISCGWWSRVLSQFFIWKSAWLLTWWDNIQVLWVVDRSNSNPWFIIWWEVCKTDGDNLFDEIERNQFHLDYPGMKMLKRREIENYLYDPEICAQFEPKISTILSQEEFLNGEVKNKLSGISEISRISKIDLASKIIPGTKVYDELAACIFS